jgi:hypothetical protein
MRRLNSEHEGECASYPMPVDLPRNALGNSMKPAIYRIVLVLLGGGFAVVSSFLCIPPMLEGPVDVRKAVFVNPFSSAFALDAIFCFLLLVAWVAYEARAKGVRHGWIAIVLGVSPGVATGFAFYLWLRMKQTSVTQDTGSIVKSS